MSLKFPKIWHVFQNIVVWQGLHCYNYTFHVYFRLCSDCSKTVSSPLTDLFLASTVPLEWTELTPQSCLKPPPRWPASLEKKTLSWANWNKKTKLCRICRLLPDKHRAFEKANFSRMASCWSVSPLRIKAPLSSLVFPLRTKKFQKSNSI